MQGARHNVPTGYLLWRLSMKWRAQVDRALAPLGLTHAQYSLLASLYGILHGGHRPSQRELADFSGLDPIYVSKLVKALEREGLVRRGAGLTDTRAVALELTDAGREKVQAAMHLVHGFLHEALGPLGGPESEPSREFTRLLQTLLGDTPAVNWKEEEK